jgi:hypothetical protein
MQPRQIIRVMTALPALRRIAVDVGTFLHGLRHAVDVSQKRNARTARHNRRASNMHRVGDNMHAVCLNLGHVGGVCVVGIVASKLVPHRLLIE